MAAFLSSRWLAKVVQTLPSNPRAVRRVVLNNEVAKTLKLVIGDLLLIAGSSTFDGVRNL